MSAVDGKKNGMPTISGDIRVRTPEKVDVVAFWSWNLNIVVSQSRNLDAVIFSL